MKKILICLLGLAATHAVQFAHASSADQPGTAAARKTPASAPVTAAPATPTTTAERDKRRADIDYWLKTYDGSEFTSGEYRCPSPRFPSVSKQNEDIDRVSANMEAWQDCHNRAVVNFNAKSPLSKQMPADVARLLTPEEMESATARLKQVQENVAEMLKINGKLVVADFTAWRSATNAWVKEHNDIVNSGPSEERQQDINARRNNYASPDAKR